MLPDSGIITLSAAVAVVKAIDQDNRVWGQYNVMVKAEVVNDIEGADVRKIIRGRGWMRNHWEDGWVRGTWSYPRMSCGCTYTRMDRDQVGGPPLN